MKQNTLAIMLFSLICPVLLLAQPHGNPDKSGIPPSMLGTPESEMLLQEFPFLGKLLTADNPWEMEPQSLAQGIFSRMPGLVQGSAEYPLLFRDQREMEGWPGEKVFNQYAYESEFYTFDREYPVIKLHIGRPLIFGLQHGRAEAVVKIKHLAPQFPVLDPEEIAPLLAQLDALAETLAPFGAKREPSGFYLASCYLLPNGVKMTVTNYTGSSNGTPYVEIELRPQSPVKKFAGTQTLAFPGAEGSGRYSVGGRGGKVYVVTSLEDYLPEGRPGRLEGTYGQASGYALTIDEKDEYWIPYINIMGTLQPDKGRRLLPPFPALPPEEVIHGTLREAVEAEGPRYVVFAVSGDIELKTDLVIRNPYITIAGQTAPGEGVQIRNWGVYVETHDVILRHLRIRVGDTKGPGDLQHTLGERTHGLDVNAMNIIVDHCEIAYASDQIFNVYGRGENRVGITLQWSYIYGGPRKSTHEKGDHSMITVGVGWGYVSSHHNLLAHGRVRNPRADMLHYDFRNNVIYNFQGTGYGSENDYLRLNHIGNYFKKGPDSKRKSHLYAFIEETLYGQWYGEGNRLPEDFKGLFDCPEKVIIDHPHLMVPVTTHSADEAFQLVLAEGGATKPVRDSITSYVIQTVMDGSGFIPNSANDWPCGGFPSYRPAEAPEDQNGNGIPDGWEISMGLKTKDCLATGRDLDPHYDNIEVYMNSL